MKRITHRFSFIIFVLLLAIGLTACGSSEPCSCGRTPTKGYKNESTGEREYYCEVCASDCAFCSHDATMHYTSGLGIMFVCDDCYEYIQKIRE